MGEVEAEGVESFGRSGVLVSSMTVYVDDFTENMAAVSSSTNTGWVPRIIPVRHPQTLSKGDKIAELEWRFQAGKIKYPAHRKFESPVAQLWEQTENFTKDLALLRYDDLIDCIALSNYLLHTRGRKAARDPVRKTLAEQIQSNEPAARGLPLLSVISGSTLSWEQIDALLCKHYDDTYKKNLFTTRAKPNIVQL